MRGRATETARHAVPIAKNAGLATRHHTQRAIGRAKPHVNRARVWAAPKVEQAGLAVRDRIAPKVSAALVATAHRLDTRPRRTRRWPRRVAGSAMLAALASAALAMATRHRPGAMTRDHGPGDNGAASVTGPATTAPATTRPATTGPPTSPGEPGKPGKPGDGNSGTGSAG